MRARFANAAATGALAIALLALPALSPASASAARTVSVSAEATLRVPNDSASLGFGVSLQRRSRGAALQATSARLRAVIAAVQKVPGVGTGDLRTGRISVHRSRGGAGKALAYRASEGIGVTLHEPQLAGQLVGAAIGAGASGVRGPTYFVGDPEAAEASALAAAFDKAKARAAVLAAQAGAALGQVLSIDEGEGAEFTPLPNQEESASGCTAAPVAPVAKRTTGTARASACAKAAPAPSKPGSSTVTATVHAVFELL